jgi:hypothetical protein
MITIDFILQFAGTWLFTMAYLVALAGLAFRLRKLKTQRSSIDVPNVDFRGGTVSAGDIFAVLRFVFSSRHVAVGDSLTSRLVIAVRILFPIGLMLVLLVFVRVAFLRGFGAD